MGSLWRGMCAAAVVFTACQTPAWAVLLETQSNPVAHGAIIIAPAHRVDWDSIPAYTADPGADAGLIDFTQVQMAHDDDNIYVRFLLAEQVNPMFYGFQHNLFMDTDSDRDTGFYGAGSFLPNGYEFLIQGPSAFSFAGGVNQEAFSWSYITGLLWDDFPTTDIEVAIPRTAIGDPAAFNFVINAASLPEDYYPDNANTGEEGDYFRYEVPEPATGMLLMLAALWPRRVRR